MDDLPITISKSELEALCVRWKIRELALFGSVLRDDFGPGSDVDVLVTFEDGARWSLLDVVTFREELADLLRHDVDIVERPALERHHNPWLKHAILSEARVWYRAA